MYKQLLNQFKEEQIFFTSDTHAWHKNLAAGTSQWSKNTRDFPDQNVMTDHIAKSINSVVGEDDLLFHLGDWSFGGIQNIALFRDLIDCKNIIHFYGNHDLNNGYPEEFNKLRGVTSEMMGFYKIGDQQISISHYPIASWHSKAKGAWNLFGHCHSMFDNGPGSLDVGIDNAFKLYGEYRPFKLSEVYELCNHK